MINQQNKVKKVYLAFSTPSEQYSVPWSVERINHPLQSGLAILARSLEEKVSGIDVQCIGNQAVGGTNKEEYRFNYKTMEEFVERCENSDVVGLSVLLNNLTKSIEIAKELKKRNPKQIIVFGGSGVSDNKSAKLVLQQADAVDYVVKGDGEQPLVDIVRGEKPANIPNILYRENGEVKRSKNKFSSDLNDRQLWDFTSTPDYQDVMRAFDSRTDLFQKLRGGYGNFIGMVGVQLSKGCEKAEAMGRCSYCVSAQSPKVVVRDANRFWEEVTHLYKTHGITEYFIVDNVLATPKKLDALLEAKENYSIPEEIQFRAYGYVPFFFQEGGTEIMGKLKSAGVRNLFLGVESFDKKVNELSNKPGFELSQVEQVVEQASRYGTDMFLPIMVGLPGDSRESLEYNLECMETLLSKYGSREYGQGGLVRVDLSMAMPLRGTLWYNQLAKKQAVLNYYKQETGVDLAEHLDPDYDVLRDVSLRFHHSTGLTGKDLDSYRKRFSEMCCKYIRPEQIGGFEPTVLKEGGDC
ncbi:B12-binding domain-containing radical SAM protein [Nanoarchaeota archaeon]